MEMSVCTCLYINAMITLIGRHFSSSQGDNIIVNLLNYLTSYVIVDRPTCIYME